jgi:hypothetical protein
VKPSPQGVKTDRANEELSSTHGSVRRSEDQSLTLNCSIDPEDKTGQNALQWKYSLKGEHFDDVPDGVRIEKNALIIDQVKKAHRGYYQCELNDVTFTVLLRVKGW